MTPEPTQAPAAIGGERATHGEAALALIKATEEYQDQKERSANARRRTRAAKIALDKAATQAVGSEGSYDFGGNRWRIRTHRKNTTATKEQVTVLSLEQASEDALVDGGACITLE